MNLLHYITWKGAVVIAATAVVSSVLTVAVRVPGISATSHRSVFPISVGGGVTFNGTGWSCYSNRAPYACGTMPGSKNVKSAPFHVTVTCRYLVDSGGCPFLQMADPYLWVADSHAVRFRTTGTGAVFIRTHFGCD